MKVAVPEDGASSCAGLATDRVRSHVLTLPPWRPSQKRPVTLLLPGTGRNYSEQWGRGVLHVLEGSVRCSGETADAAEVVLAQGGSALYRCSGHEILVATSAQGAGRGSNEPAKVLWLLVKPGKADTQMPLQNG